MKEATYFNIILNTSLKLLFEKISFLSALRYPRYRLYFIGTIVAINGFNLWLTAQLWHVYDLTGEPRYFAFLGMVVIGPTLILNLFGGVAADKLNKRYLIIYTQLMAGIIMLIIAIITFTGHLDVWQLIIGSAILSAVLAFDTPSRQSIWVQFIDRKDLVNAVENGGKTACDAAEARRATEIGFAIHMSHNSSGAKIQLPAADRSLRIESFPWGNE